MLCNSQQLRFQSFGFIFHKFNMIFFAITFKGVLNTQTQSFQINIFVFLVPFGKKLEFEAMSFSLFF